MSNDDYDPILGNCLPVLDLIRLSGRDTRDGLRRLKGIQKRNKARNEFTRYLAIVITDLEKIIAYWDTYIDGQDNYVEG